MPSNNKAFILGACLGAAMIGADGALLRGGQKGATAALNFNASSISSPVAFFNQNSMYQGNPYEEDVDARTKLQAAIFRSISGAGYRSYNGLKTNQSFCGTDNSIPSAEGIGRKYKFEEFRSWTIHLVDLYSMLQFDRQCSDKTLAFRQLMVQTERPTLGEAVLGDDDAAGLWWWEEKFLPALTEAFSCGFGPSDLVYQPDFLPPDISSQFQSSPNNMVPKIWRLTKGFIMSAQLQRADVPRRQQVFEPSHYIPFMDRYVAGGHEWTRRGVMGLQIPVYQGPNNWYTWHTMAQRFADVMDACDSDTTCKTHAVCSPSGCASFPAYFQKQVITKFASMLKFFALAGQTCPQCREHFISQVSRNDMLWQDHANAGWDPAYHNYTEARVYPMEWLYAGIAPENLATESDSDSGTHSGWQLDAGTLPQKLTGVKSATDLVLFIWKLHNAVQSSVRYSRECRVTETYDTTHNGLYQCRDPKVGVDPVGPRFERSWPYQDRFRFWLKGGQQQWQGARSNKLVVAAAEALHLLDTPATRERFWTMSTADRAAAVRDPTTAKEIGAVLAAIRKLDQAVLASGVLQNEYSAGAAVSSFEYVQAAAIERELAAVVDPEWEMDTEPIQECKSTGRFYRPGLV